MILKQLPSPDDRDPGLPVSADYGGPGLPGGADLGGRALPRGTKAPGLRHDLK